MADDVTNDECPGSTDEPITQERRMIVKGWKVEIPYGYRKSRRSEFTSIHSNACDRSIEFERERITNQPTDDWQPHITEVVVETRYVTPWKAED